MPAADALAAQPEVGHHEIEAFCAQPPERHVALDVEQLHEHVADGLLILDYKHKLGGVG